MACPYCGEQIPANSVFCPSCGKAVENKPGRTTTTTTSHPEQGMTYNEQRAQARREAGRQANAWQQPQPVEDNEEEDDNGNNRRSHYDRNLIIGIVVAALIIGLLSLLRHCNSQENDRLAERADSAALIADSSQDAIQVLSAELSRNNMTDDKAYTGCAVKFPSTDPDTPERIVGVTYKDDTDRPFIKVYNLTRDGAQWKTELGQTKYFDGRSIIMDNSSLIADAM